MSVVEAVWLHAVRQHLNFRVGDLTPPVKSQGLPRHYLHELRLRGKPTRILFDPFCPVTWFSTPRALLDICRADVALTIILTLVFASSRSHNYVDQSKKEDQAQYELVNVSSLFGSSFVAFLAATGACLMAIGCWKMVSIQK